MPGPQILINYVIYPPYVAPPTDYSDGKPTGILVSLSEASIKHCLGKCDTVIPNITYRPINLNFNKWHHFNHTTSEFFIPMVKKSQYSDHGSNIPLTVSPGSVLIEVPEKEEVVINNREMKVLKQLLATAPMIALFFLMNWLAGSLFWYSVRIKGDFVLEMIKISII